MDYIKISAQTITHAKADPLYGAHLNSLSNISRAIAALLIDVGSESQEHLHSFMKLEIDYAQGLALSAPEPYASWHIGIHACAACNYNYVA